MSEISPQVQNQLAQLQQVQQQAQALSAQKSQMEMALREVEMALEEIGKLDESSVMYRNIGELFVKSDKENVSTELSDKKETFELRLKTLERQEERIQKRFQQLQQQIREAIGGSDGGQFNAQ
ncbi:MAG: prefoldin subunit beta [Halobacteriota archaeon]|nr:prefoldin subunit beta [Halobacteriota archaeon]